jgi:hypothetical protein
MSHHKCQQTGDPCPYITNSDRITALRKLLGATKTLLGRLNVDYMLYGGTAIGQYRCGDVLPWDADNDIMIPRKDLFRMHEIIFGRPWRDLANESESSSLGYGEYSQDLAKWGAPGYKLMKKSNCIIYELVDVNSGFYTDMFPLDYHAGSGMVPWPGAPVQCHTWTKCASTCYQFWDQDYWPIEDCLMSGISMRCPKDRAAVLVSTYNAAVLIEPDVRIG